MSVTIETPAGKRLQVALSPAQPLSAAIDDVIQRESLVPADAASWRLLKEHSGGNSGRYGGGLRAASRGEKRPVELDVPFRLLGLPKGTRLWIVRAPQKAEKTQSEVQNGAQIGGENDVAMEDSAAVDSGDASGAAVNESAARETSSLESESDVAAAAAAVNTSPLAAGAEEDALAPSAPSAGVPALAPRVITPDVRDALVDHRDRDVDEKFYDHTLSDVKQLATDQKRVVAQREGVLLTKKLRDEQEAAKATFGSCKIRVRFPNRTEVEGSFHPDKAKVSDVADFVRSALTNSEAEFELFTTPPRKVLKHDLTLRQAQLVPLALIHISFRGDAAAGSALKPEFVAAYAVGAAALRPQDASSSSSSAAAEPKTSASRQPKSASGASKLPKWFSMGRR